MNGILSFESEFVRRNPGRIQVLRFMREAIGVTEIEWSMITTLNLNKVREHICESVAGNSACTYLAILKAFLASYIDENLFPCKNPHKELKAKRVPSEQVVLSASEIALIEAYRPKTEKEKWVKAQFLCEYYCLARSSDIRQLTTENIQGDFITYVSQKTKVATTVPLHKNFIKYFKQRGQTLDRASFNRIIKRICMNCGINEDVKLFYHGKVQIRKKYELIGSHTARRSGATELAKRDVPIATISKLMNHTNTLITSRYIFADTRNLGEEAMSFFTGE
jgi:integrase